MLIQTLVANKYPQEGEKRLLFMRMPQDITSQPYSNHGTFCTISALQHNAYIHYSTNKDPLPPLDRISGIILDATGKYQMFGGRDGTKVDWEGKMRYHFDAIRRGIPTYFNSTPEFNHVDYMYKESIAPRCIGDKQLWNLAEYAGFARNDEGMKELGIWYTQKMREAEVLIAPHRAGQNVVFGDSHAQSVWQVGDLLRQQPGRLLWSILNEGLIKYIPDGYIPVLSVALGNIDIRYHLAYRDDSSTVELAHRYIDQLTDILENKDVENINVMLPLPIERESRKLSRVYAYKDKLFIGERSLRFDKLMLFIKSLVVYNTSSRIRFLSVPVKYYTLDEDVTVEYETEFMERRQGVHINPEKYRFISYFDKSML